MSMTTKEIIDVVAGFSRGEKVQYRNKDSDDPWCNALTDPVWNFEETDYRLKPKGPRKCYVRWEGDELLCLDERDMEEPYDDDMRAEGWIEVVEVVK